MSSREIKISYEKLSAMEQRGILSCADKAKPIRLRKKANLIKVRK